MENHHEERHLLSAFIDNELKDDEKVIFELHLADCPSCQKECDQLRRTKGVLAASLRHSIPADLLDTLQHQADRPTLWGQIQVWFGAPKIWIPAGSLAALLLLIGFWVGFTPEDAVKTLPLEPLLAAHSRYTAESLVPHRHASSLNFSIQLARYDAINH